MKIPNRCVGAVHLLALAFLALLIHTAIGCSSNSSPALNTANITRALWVANGTNVVEWLPSQFSSTSSAVAPHLANNSGSFGAPQGVVFDSFGNLWVIDGGTVASGGTIAPALYQFTAAQLSALGTSNSPTPNIIINSSSFMFPQQAVFDSSGSLWVTDSVSNEVFQFTAAQLTASSADLTPNICINSGFMGALGIAFDSSGDLWVANNASTCIFEFLAGNLPTSSGSFTLTPDVMLSDDGNGSIQAPWALAFDNGGSLWSSNASAPNTVVAFPISVLGTSGSPVPVVSLYPTTDGGNTTLNSPNGIAFDNLGDLAVVNSMTPFGAAVFSQVQLVNGGTPKPAAFLVGSATTLNAPAGSTFGPIVN